MASSKTYKTHFRRRREGKTDYAKRLALVKSGQKRLVVRKTSRRIIAQLVRFENAGDKTIVFASSTELKGFGWKASLHNLPAGYLTGLLVGKRAVAKGEKKGVLDIGLQTAHPRGVLFAVAKGAIDAGMELSVSAEVLPTPERIRGQHIESFAQKSAADRIEKQFSGYLKNEFDPKKIVDAFEKTKTAVLAHATVSTTVQKR